MFSTNLASILLGQRCLRHVGSRRGTKNLTRFPLLHYACRGQRLDDPFFRLIHRVRMQNIRHLIF